jgi:hypothetical protein
MRATARQPASHDGQYLRGKQTVKSRPSGGDTCQKVVWPAYTNQTGFDLHPIVAEAHDVEDRRAEADPRAKSGTVIHKYSPLREERVHTCAQKDTFPFFGGWES